MSEERENISNRKGQKQIVIRAAEKEFNQIRAKVKKSRLIQNKYLLNPALDKEITVVGGIKELERSNRIEHERRIESHKSRGGSR